MATRTDPIFWPAFSKPMKKALRGSILDIERIGSFSESQPRTNTFPEFLPVVYAHLNLARLPDSARDLSEAEARLVRANFVLLERLIAGKSVRELEQTVVPSIMGHWKQLYAWIYLILDDSLSLLDPSLCPGSHRPPRKPDHSIIKTCSTICILLSAFTVLNGLRGLMNTPQLRSVIVKVWRGELSTKRPLGIPGPAHIANAMMIQQEAKWAAEIARAMGGDLDMLISFIDRMPKRQETLDLKLIANTLAIVTHLCNSVPGLTMRLLARDYIVTVTTYLSALSAAPDTPQELIDIAPLSIGRVQRIRGLAHCFQFLCQSVPMTDGYTWVLRAVNAQLLPSTLQTAAVELPARFDRFRAAILRYIIPPYLAYRSILRSVERSVRAIERKHLDADLEVQSSLSLRHAWSTLKHALDGFIPVKVHFDEEQSVRNCSSRVCDNIDTEGTFHRCASCKDALYCSRLCQRIDWRGHRPTCREMQRCHQVGSISCDISQRDVNFFYAVVRHIMSAYGTAAFRGLALEKIRNRLPAHTDLDLLVYNVHLDRLPATFTVDYIDDLSISGGYGEAPRAQWNAILQSKKVDAMLCRVYIARGTRRDRFAFWVPKDGSVLDVQDAIPLNNEPQGLLEYKPFSTDTFVEST